MDLPAYGSKNALWPNSAGIIIKIKGNGYKFSIVDMWKEAAHSHSMETDYF